MEVGKKEKRYEYDAEYIQHLEHYCDFMHRMNQEQRETIKELEARLAKYEKR